MLRAYYVLYNKLENAEKAPKLNIMDNKASRRTVVQLAPPQTHKRNAAECAIRTFKHHVVSVLESVDNKLLIYLWLRIVKQAEITINVLRTSRTNPRLLVYAQIFGTFDFNTTPIAPLGNKITTHENPMQCATWRKHGVAGWYIGPELEHYRCYKVFVTETRSEIFSDVVEFTPKM